MCATLGSGCGCAMGLQSRNPFSRFHTGDAKSVDKKGKPSLEDQPPPDPMEPGDDRVEPGDATATCTPPEPDGFSQPRSSSASPTSRGGTRRDIRRCLSQPSGRLRQVEVQETAVRKHLSCFRFWSAYLAMGYDS